MREDDIAAKAQDHARGEDDASSAHAKHLPLSSFSIAEVLAAQDLVIDVAKEESK